MEFGLYSFSQLFDEPMTANWGVTGQLPGTPQPRQERSV